jgi:ankyrin repeat protein
MSIPAPGPAPDPQPLPDDPSLEWLRKAAKRRLAEMRASHPAATLSLAQLDVARRHGFRSWRALRAHVDAASVAGRLFAAARAGDADALAALLDAHPDGLHVRARPYGATLLHLAATHGHLAATRLLLARGMDPDVRERGDHTTPMHWAAAGGHLDVVRALADAGGDVVGAGDDHALEIIGWATCWERPHADVADLLVSRGARHHVFSAVALGRADEVRRVVRDDPAALHRRMSRNEDHRLPLHFAVLKGRAEMVRLLLELGADPLAVDGSGFPAAACATSLDVDRAVMERVREMTAAELVSAARGDRPPRISTLDLVAALALGDAETAARVAGDARPGEPGGPTAGALHLLAKRGDAEAVRWLLARGADPNARWAHWDAEVTPLHLAAAHGHAETVRLLLDAGADSAVRDSKHDGDAAGWAEHFGQPEIARMLRTHPSR